MRAKYRPLISIIPLFLASAVLANKHTQMPKNSFLEYRATSVSMLLDEVRSRKSVVNRYERHFLLTRKELLAKFAKLHVASLVKPKGCYVFSVPSSGAIKRHRETLPAGSKVFEDRSNTPILLMKCGNPLTGATPENEGTEDLGLDSLMKGKKGMALNDQSPDPDLPMALDSAQVPDDDDFRPEVFAANDDPSGTIIVAHHAAVLPDLAVLAGFAALTGTAAIMSKTNSPPPPQPAPEPSEFLAILGGAMGLGLFAKKRRFGRPE